MQIILYGIIQGILFALIGISFSLVYSTTRTFHIALGGIYAVAPYIFLMLFSNGLGLIFSLSAAVAVATALGILCEEALHWPFLQKSAPPEVHLIGSLGMFLVIGQVIALIWGNDIQVLRQGVDRVYHLPGDIRLAQAQLVGAGGGAAVLALFFFWLNKSELGLQLRAMADNPILLGLLGRNVRKLRRMVFGVSGAIAAVAALGTAYDTGFDPNVGLSIVLVGMVATIVGGRGSFIGTAIAGLLLGIIRAQVVWYSSARWEEMITFMILALILFFRPQGIFGRKLRLEEKV